MSEGINIFRIPDAWCRFAFQEVHPAVGTAQGPVPLLRLSIRKLFFKPA